MGTLSKNEKIPNHETSEAIEELELKEMVSFEGVDALMDDLHSDES